MIDMIKSQKHCQVEFSAVMEIFYIFPLQYKNYLQNENVEH